MKKIVLVFGLIASIIITTMMVITTALCYNNPAYQDGGMIVGYATMIISFSFIFVAIKRYRDKQNGGVISFGKAFTIGLYISLIASTIYVGVWLFEYYTFFPDFMDKYTAHVLETAKRDGASAAEIQAQLADIEGYSEMYKTPVGVILLTYMEVLPVGLIVSLIAALILKRKTQDPQVSIS